MTDGGLWRRRFNQSALLAQRIARSSAVAYEPFLLQRMRRTASQVGLTMEPRRRNVAGAFAVPVAQRQAVQGRVVVLVDDVLTGATANAYARGLKRADAARVDVLTLARVVDPLTCREYDGECDRVCDKLALARPCDLAPDRPLIE